MKQAKEKKKRIIVSQTGFGWPYVEFMDTKISSVYDISLRNSYISECLIFLYKSVTYVDIKWRRLASLGI